MRIYHQIYATIIAMLPLFLSANPNVETTVNRDLSQQLPNYHRVNQEVATAGQPSPEHWAELAKQGFKTVINLRTAEEGALDEQMQAKQASLHYVNIPVISGVPMTAGQAKQLADALANHPKPVLIHCASGNRVGGLWALYRMQQGVAQETALQEGRKIGMKEGIEMMIKQIKP